MTNLLSDDTFLRIKTARRIRTLLSREKQLYMKELHQRSGVGLDTASFQDVVKGLADGGLVTLKAGKLGAVMVVFNETPSQQV
ncbi:MAG: hypothetical protein WCF22_00540 [Candidatus Sulfotelmatobacter sp.]